jgi:autotransporter-associated beta strand protein
MFTRWLAASLALLVAPCARAQLATTWTRGAVTNDWTNASNWSAGVPVAGFNAIFGTNVGGDPNQPYHLSMDKITFAPGNASHVAQFANWNVNAAGTFLEVQSGNTQAQTLVANRNGGGTILLKSGTSTILNNGSHATGLLFGASVGGINAKLTGASGANSTLVVDGSGITTIGIGRSATATNMVISDGNTGGVLSLTKTGSGTLTLNSANTHTGTTSVGAGTIRLTNTLALQFSPFGTDGINGSSGTLDITAALSSGTLILGGLSGAANLASLNIVGFPGVTNLRLNPPASGSPVYFGSIADGPGPRSLTKTGAGTQTLAGANTYTGPTAVNEGALLVDGSLAAASAVTVAPGATLGGRGTIPGPVTIHGSLQPTVGGTLRFTGPLTLGGSSRTVIPVARNGEALASGRIETSTPLALGGTLVIQDAGSDQLRTGDVCQLFDPANTTGSFANVILPPGYTFDPARLAEGVLAVTLGAVKPGFTQFSLAGDQVTLAWPGAMKGWWLQVNTNGLASGGWQDIVGSDAVTGVTFPLDPLAKSEFYRLRAPTAADLPFAADPLAKGGSLDIASVWSGVSPGFAFLTTQNLQIAAYYDASRQLVVSARDSDSTAWTHQATGETFAGWDHHNWVAAAIDPQGYLHMAADMHNQPMNYFRSAAPLTDAAQLAIPGFIQRISPLWNASLETRCTYPRWFESPNGEFCFNYREKSDPNTHHSVVLRWDPAAKTWSQTTGTASLFSWNPNSIYSVYHNGPTRAGGRFHFVYNWTAANRTLATSDHRLGYVRSSDMVNWTDAFDRPVTLPIGPTTASGTVIDNIPIAGGLSRLNYRLMFDRQGDPIVAYHKWDAAGKSQIYVARPDRATQTWKIVKLTSSTVRFDLVTAGSASNFFQADDPLDGLVTLQISLVGSDGTAYPGNGYYTLDENTLENLTGNTPNAMSYAAANSPQSQSGIVDPAAPENTYVAPVSNATMQVNRLPSSGLDLSAQQYYLRWESLPKGNDQPRTDASGNEISPTPSTLRLYRTQADFGDPATGGNAYGLLFEPPAARRYGAMVLESDPVSPFRYTLTSAQTGAPHLAEWTFRVDAADDYALGGVALGAGAQQGFLVQIDENPPVFLPARSYWDYQPVREQATGGMVRFPLSPGQHTLRVIANDAGAKLAYLWMNRAADTKTPSLAPVAHTGFTLAPDSGAVCGYSLRSASDPSAFSATYQIPVPATGNYRLIARTRAPGTNSNSFRLSINGAAASVWDLPVTGTQWAWAPVQTLTGLATGTLTLTVSGSEAGAELDSFMLLKIP